MPAIARVCRSAWRGARRAARRAAGRLGIMPRIGSDTFGALIRNVGADAKTILEIGANDGTDTNALLAAFPSATIHCFEPEPRAFELFRANVTSERARLYGIALGATNGTTTFYRSDGVPPGREGQFPEGWHLSGSIRQPTGHLTTHTWCRFDRSIEVTVRTLDSWSEEHAIGPIDLIWADVQGAETDVILGGTSALKRTRFLYTEFSDREEYVGQASLSVIKKRLGGWTLLERFPYDVLFGNKRRWRGRWSRD